jgi:hypothetical protein
VNQNLIKVELDSGPVRKHSSRSDIARLLFSLLVRRFGPMSGNRFTIALRFTVGLIDVVVKFIGSPARAT